MSQDFTPHQTDLGSVIEHDSPSVTTSTSQDSPSRNGRAVVQVRPPIAKKSARSANAPGLHIERRYTKPGVDVYDTVEWDRRDALISNEKGEKVFEQKNVEMPTNWTQLATNVVVSKYFRGHVGTPERESSVRQLIGRVADTIAGWGHAMDYFATEDDSKAFQGELTHILLHQMAAFN